MNGLFHAVSKPLQLAESETPRQHQAIGCHWFVLFLSMAAGAGIAVRLGQGNSFDVLNYHYYSGFALLHKPFNYAGHWIAMIACGSFWVL